MKKINWKIILLIYFSIFAFFTGIYLASFQTFLFSNQKVLFYRGIILLLFTLLITISFSLFFYFKWVKSHLESMISAIIVTAALHLSIFVIFPVTFERSVTTYLLTVLKSNNTNPSCNGLTKSELTEKLINEYILKKDAVAKRIEE